VTSLNTFGNTGSWISGINAGLLPNISTGYQKSHPTAPVQRGSSLGNGYFGAGARAVPIRFHRAHRRREHERDATIGSIRGNAERVQAQIANLEQDSFSADPNMNSEVSVLNKINAANVLTLRTVQDSNKLLASLLEQQTILAKQQREATTNAINADISRRANLSGNMSQVTSTLTNHFKTSGCRSTHAASYPSRRRSQHNGLSEVHLSGHQQLAHAESRLLRRNGAKPFPFLRHNPRGLVRGKIGSLLS